MARDSTGESAPADGALVARARRGDAAAFRALYDRHAPATLAYLRRLLPDRGRSEDALADTFVRAHAGLASWDPARQLAGWLLGIARHVALDALRAAARQGKPLERDVPASGPGPHESAAVRESEALALELLAALPERSRRVVLLRYRQGLTQSETAAELGCSRRLVATLQKEALEALARLARERREASP